MTMKAFFSASKAPLVQQIATEDLDAVRNEVRKLFPMDFPNLSTDGDDRDDDGCVFGLNTYHNRSTRRSERSERSSERSERFPTGRLPILHKLTSIDVDGESDTTRSTCDSSPHEGEEDTRNARSGPKNAQNAPNEPTAPLRRHPRGSAFVSRHFPGLCGTRAATAARHEEDANSIKKRSATIPVKGTTVAHGQRRPVPRRDSPSEVDQSDNSDDEEHLKRMYDMRTWDMFLRITEARKKSSFAGTATPAAAAYIDAGSAPVFPALLQSKSVHINQDERHERHDEAIFSEHELVFGDLDD